MIGIVVVTHGKLALELVAAMEHVVGVQDKTATICIDPDDDMENRKREIVSAIKQTDTGSGVIILTDMFGGTPSNLAISIKNNLNVEVISGVNLPLMIKLASIRNKDSLKTVVEKSLFAGKKYISVA